MQTLISPDFNIYKTCNPHQMFRVSKKQNIEILIFLLENYVLSFKNQFEAHYSNEIYVKLLRLNVSVNSWCSFPFLITKTAFFLSGCFKKPEKLRFLSITLKVLVLERHAIYQWKRQEISFLTSGISFFYHKNSLSYLNLKCGSSWARSAIYVYLITYGTGIIPSLHTFHWITSKSYISTNNTVLK